MIQLLLYSMLPKELKRLKGFTGDVYAHTGVITEYSNNDTDWKYVIAGWTTNVQKAKMTPLGNDLYKITIKPNPKIFYGVPSSEKILRTCFRIS